ncbi:MAG: NADH-quinone oxidoreductase subunit L, partial [Thermoleophilaceae bacterium]
MTAASYGWLVLAFPIVGLLAISLGWKVWPGRTPGWIASAAILASFVASILMLIKLQDLPAEGRHITDSAFTYFDVAGFKIDLSIFVDPLSVFMCLVVSGVSFLIHLYSISYMTGDKGFTRYFAYLNYFVFSMLLLVLAGNVVLLIVGWAFVGAASYL